MKVLYIIHQFFPEHYTGTEKIFLNISRMAQMYGYKAKIVTYSYYDKKEYDQFRDGYYSKEFVYQGIPVLALRYENWTNLPYHNLADKHQTQIARALLERENPDFVHVAHTMRMPEFTRLLPQMGIPYILSLTDFFLICPKYTLITSEDTLCRGPQGGSLCQKLCPELPADMIKNRLQQARDMLYQADVVTCLTQFQADIVQEEFPDLKIKVINPGLRYSHLENNMRQYKSGDALTIVFAGSFTLHKGVHTLIEAVKRVDAPNLKLKIYGSGVDKAVVKKIKNAGAGDSRIEFMGRYEEAQIGKVFKDADLVVVPSLWYETYCLVMHEAFACNVPVVGSDVGVMGEKIIDGKNGFQFKMGDPVSLKAVLQKVADNPAILNDMKKHLNQMLIPNVEQEACAHERIYKQMRADVVAAG